MAQNFTALRKHMKRSLFHARKENCKRTFFSPAENLIILGVLIGGTQFNKRGKAGDSFSARETGDWRFAT